jgi:RNA:NAD 2'-phosphotransferase (TPT1/KptA family)
VNVRASKAMSYILRHGAEKEGIKMGTDGYILLADLLKTKKLRNIKKETVFELVKNCPK